MCAYIYKKKKKERDKFGIEFIGPVCFGGIAIAFVFVSVCGLLSVGKRLSVGCFKFEGRQVSVLVS